MTYFVVFSRISSCYNMSYMGSHQNFLDSTTSCGSYLPNWVTVGRWVSRWLSNVFSYGVKISKSCCSTKLTDANKCPFKLVCRWVLWKGKSNCVEPWKQLQRREKERAKEAKLESTLYRHCSDHCAAQCGIPASACQSRQTWFSFLPFFTSTSTS